ncbi:MAG: LysM peptidoglycan-binding domain-containing protein [Thermoanaerobaculia bacterium]|nr:LysM peptidoglycan-binding domain-containing protein [Thermoanaerobaculia bacterium]
MRIGTTPTALRLLGLVVALPGLFATTSGAQPAPANAAPPEDVDRSVIYEAWYVVRPGDTLEAITQRYLGDYRRWEENWSLNPQLRNPHNLTPGERLRILLRSIPDEGALLTKKSNRVENEQPPLSWQEARLRDVMKPRDSVRTFEASSAELTFGDDTRLTVSEESLVFLDRKLTTGPAPVSRDQIEIVVGQADLGGRGVDSAGEAIELILGEAVALPRPSDAGQIQTRARKEEGGAQLMAYEGGSTLAASGVEIDVPQGMGSSVKEGTPPGPPEKLLPAPEQVAPEDGARLMTPRPEIEWRPVEGAAGYFVEICLDEDCAELIARAKVASGDLHSWRSEDALPVADLFWRVTAYSPSGLDGYPSGTEGFTVASDSEDQIPPNLDVSASGPHLPPRTGLNEMWILGPGATLGALVDDSQTGVEQIEYAVDGEPATADAWAGPWQPGAHEATLTAVDGAGNRAEALRVPFVYDVEAPALSWGVEGVGFLGDIATDASLTLANPEPDRSKKIFEVDDPHSFWWWRKQIWTVRHDGYQLTITPSRPVVVKVLASSDNPSNDDLGVVLSPDRGIWVLARDEGCGPSLQLGYELDIAEERIGRRRHGVLTLGLVAEDGVTNSGGAMLRIVTSKAGRKARRQLADPK